MGEFNIYKKFEQEICLFLDHFLSVSPLKTAKKVQIFSRASRAGEFNFYKISQNLLWGNLIFTRTGPAGHSGRRSRGNVIFSIREDRSKSLQTYTVINNG